MTILFSIDEKDSGEVISIPKGTNLPIEGILCSNGTEASLSETETIFAHIRKPDGSINIKKVSFSGNSVSFTIDLQDTDISGKIAVELFLIQKDLSYLTTNRFLFRVSEGRDLVPSNNDKDASLCNYRPSKEGVPNDILEQVKMTSYPVLQEKMSRLQDELETTLSLCGKEKLSDLEPYFFQQEEASESRNIFIQQAEPSTKHGLWVRAVEKPIEVVSLPYSFHFNYTKEINEESPYIMDHLKVSSVGCLETTVDINMVETGGRFDDYSNSVVHFKGIYKGTKFDLSYLFSKLPKKDGEQYDGISTAFLMEDNVNPYLVFLARYHREDSLFSYHRLCLLGFPNNFGVISHASYREISYDAYSNINMIACMEEGLDRNASNVYLLYSDSGFIKKYTTENKIVDTGIAGEIEAVCDDLIQIKTGTRHYLYQKSNLAQIKEIGNVLLIGKRGEDFVFIPTGDGNTILFYNGSVFKNGYQIRTQGMSFRKGCIDVTAGKIYLFHGSGKNWLSVSYCFDKSGYLMEKLLVSADTTKAPIVRATISSCAIDTVGGLQVINRPVYYNEFGFSQPIYYGDGTSWKEVQYD